MAEYHQILGWVIKRVFRDYTEVDGKIVLPKDTIITLEKLQDVMTSLSDQEQYRDVPLRSLGYTERQFNRKTLFVKQVDIEIVKLIASTRFSVEVIHWGEKYSPLVDLKNNRKTSGNIDLAINDFVEAVKKNGIQSNTAKFSTMHLQNIASYMLNPDRRKREMDGIETEIAYPTLSDINAQITDGQLILTPIFH
jgi:hypothetical protein